MSIAQPDGNFRLLRIMAEKPEDFAQSSQYLSFAEEALEWDPSGETKALIQAHRPVSRANASHLALPAITCKGASSKTSRR
ncbi:hypothetical protein DXU03_38845 [Rhizobium johnstonii]